MEERHEIRWGGFAGIAYAVTALVGYAIGGQPPRVDDPAREISAYFVDNKEQLLAQTLLMCVAAVCLVAFASALAQVLRDRMPGSDVPWVLISGVVLIAGLMFIGSTLVGSLAFLGGSGASVTTLYVVIAVLFTVAGIAGALPLIAASVGVVATGVLPRWTGWFAGVAAVVNVVGAFAVFNDTGALSPGGFIMSALPFLVATAWIVVTSGYLVREHLPQLAASPEAMGHA